MEEMNFMSIERWMEHLDIAQRENNLPEFDKAADQLKTLIKIDKCKIGIQKYMEDKNKFIESQDRDALERFKTAVNGSSFAEVLHDMEQVVLKHDEAINNNLLKYMTSLAKFINNEGYLAVRQKLLSESKEVA